MNKNRQFDHYWRIMLTSCMAVCILFFYFQSLTLTCFTSFDHLFIHLFILKARKHTIAEITSTLKSWWSWCESKSAIIINICIVFYVRIHGFSNLLSIWILWKIYASKIVPDLLERSILCAVHIENNI